MPQRRAAGGGVEHFTCALDDAATGARARELGRTRRGARALGLRLPAGTAPDAEGLPATGRGHAVVLAGALHDGERELPAGSVVALDRPGELRALPAGPAGAAVAVCLFAATG